MSKTKFQIRHSFRLCLGSLLYLISLAAYSNNQINIDGKTTDCQTTHFADKCNQVDDWFDLPFEAPSKQVSFREATVNKYDSITIDGDLSDWKASERINLPLNRPPYLASDEVLYGKYVTAPEPAYVIGLKSTQAAIGNNTTFWLNIDKDANTGYQVWDQYGGAEYYVNVTDDPNNAENKNQPNLYNDKFEWKGSLIHAYNADRSVIEFVIPIASMPSASAIEQVGMLIDINDTVVFFPGNYPSGGQFTIVNVPEVLPVRTDFSKRVGIVFSNSTLKNFYHNKAYSQLFMSLQHQAMMAGIPFDLLSESDLTDLSKLVNYDALIFPYFANVNKANFEKIADVLYKAVYNYKIGIITAGDLLTNYDDGSSVEGDSYRNMKRLLGVGRIDGEGPVASIQLYADDITHPVMNNYTKDEVIYTYKNHWYNYFEPVEGQIVNVLASQTVTGTKAGTYKAVIASETGGRNAHFATIEYLGNENLAWEALQWIIYGDQTSVGLKMGRYKSLFVARNDMDQAMEHDQISIVHVPLLELLKKWKTDYNFVGSYFIDIGNRPTQGIYTDWNISAPLYKQYVEIGNEIGSHSWTHPHFTDLLAPSEIEFEFNQSMNTIVNNMSNDTWRGRTIRGAAVPGAPETEATAMEIAQYLDYLSGGYSGRGAGYPSAFGYLTPEFKKVYLSPNMSFDFTLIQFGVPVGNPPVPVPLTADEAILYWQNEYAALMRHANQPIIHWPWHDYGPTISADPVTGSGYTVEMFDSTIAMAFNDFAEFTTSADLAERIETFKDVKLSINRENDVITAKVDSNNIGKFALQVGVAEGQVIKNVPNWYAYNQDKVFLDNDGGSFTINLGSTQDAVTHIEYLPMRAKLMSVTGDGINLNYTFEGEGTVCVAVNGNAEQFNFIGADSVSSNPGECVQMKFNQFGTHTASVAAK
jgi:serralysin